MLALQADVSAPGQAASSAVVGTRTQNRRQPTRTARNKGRNLAAVFEESTPDDESTSSADSECQEATAVPAAGSPPAEVALSQQRKPLAPTNINIPTSNDGQSVGKPVLNQKQPHGILHAGAATTAVDGKSPITRLATAVSAQGTPARLNHAMEVDGGDDQEQEWYDA